MAKEMWGYDPAHYTAGTDLTGFTVEATDGDIGKVDEATYEVGSACVVVNCKPWLIGRHVLIPAGLITGIDLEERTIRVGRSKDQIKGAPGYHRPGTATRDVMGGPDAVYRDALDAYYGPRLL